MDSQKYFGFGEALNLLKEGKFVARAGWNGRNMYLGLQKFDAESSSKQDYIFIIPVDCRRVPWVASHQDMLFMDWFQVNLGGVTPN